MAVFTFDAGDWWMLMIGLPIVMVMVIRRMVMKVMVMKTCRHLSNRWNLTAMCSATTADPVCATHSL